MRRPGTTLPALTALAVILALLGLGPAVQAAPAPTATAIGSVTVSGAALPGSAANNPAALVVAGQAFSVTVSLVDAAGQPLPASTNKDTTLTLSVVDSDDLPGSPMQTAVLGARRTLVVLAGQSSGTASGFTLTADNRVQLRATVTGGSKDARAIRPADSTDFDVVLTSTGLKAGSATRVSTNGGAEICALSAAAPYCADLYLPAGSDDGALISTGLCDAFLGCGSDRVVFQALAGLSTYTRTAPATLVVRCDKTACGRAGVPQFPLLVNLAASGALEEAPTCSRKGVVNDDVKACFDVKASTRDNAGDLYLHLLFVEDARVSFP